MVSAHVVTLVLIGLLIASVFTALGFAAGGLMASARQQEMCDRCERIRRAEGK